MKKNTLGQRVEACVKLIFGMRLGPIALRLAPYGLSQEVLDDAWQRLRDVAQAHPVPAPAEVELSRRLQRLADYQSTWFSLARATLGNGHVAVRDKLFHNLSQERGHLVLLSVQAFLGRIEQMEQGAQPFGPEGQPALNALQARGFTPERIAEGTALVDSFALEPTGNELAAALEREQRALGHLWAWYLEWSVICRRAIKNKNHLSALGLLPSRSAAAELEDDRVPTEAAPPPSPRLSPQTPRLPAI